MQQNVRLITFPISIFTNITNLAEFCPWKKNDPSSITYYGTHTIFLFLSPLVVKYRLNSARATPFIALRRCWGKMAKLIKGIGGHTHKPRHTLT